jgi:hypothetical protein
MLQKDSTKLGLLAVSDVSYQPFLHLAARHAFWKVEKVELMKLAKMQKVEVPANVSLYQLVVSLIKAILPGCTTDECIKYAKFRVAHGEKSDTWHDEISACDEAQAVLERSDAQAVKTEQKNAAADKQEHIEFRKEFTKASRKAAEERAKFSQKTDKQKKDELKRKYKKLPDLPPSDIPVHNARCMIPPGSFLWQDDKQGSWQGHHPPYPRKGRSWRKWGEGTALKLVLRHLWCRYLIDEGWDCDLCPVPDLFEAGEKVEDVLNDDD